MLQDFLCLFLNSLLPIHHHILGNTAPRKRVRFPHACGRATAGDDLPLCSLTTHLCICKAQTCKPVLFCRHSTLQTQVQFAIWYPPGLFLYYEFVGFSSIWIAFRSYFPLQTNFLPFSIFWKLSFYYPYSCRVESYCISCSASLRILNFFYFHLYFKNNILLVLLQYS